MNWYDWPALVFLLTFVVSLSPARRPSHYIFAFLVAAICGATVTVFTLMVWALTR